MRLESLKDVPTAILSRQIAAHRGPCLVINLPGKPAAIETCLNAVFPAVPYCLDLIGAALTPTPLSSNPSGRNHEHQRHPLDERGGGRGERLAALIADYKPLAGVPDEFIGEDGRPRDYWLNSSMP